MSSNIINYVRPTQGQNRKDINRLLEALSDYSSPPVEEAGFQQRITVTPHAKVRDTDVRFGGVDWPISETRDKGTRLMQKKVPNTPDTTPFDETWDSWGNRNLEYVTTIFDINDDKDVTNAYRYYDISSVTDYVVVAGDYLEYDVYHHDNADWDNNNFSHFIQFDYETTDASNLRGSGIVDQNSHALFGTNVGHKELAHDKWYHRKFDLTSHVGKTIDKYLLANECNYGTHGAWFRNINITDGAGTVRKVIFQDAFPTYTAHHNSNANNVVHTINSTSGFNVDNFYHFPPQDTKYGGRYKMPEAGYLWIPYHSVMDTNTLTFSMFIKLPATISGNGVCNIVSRTNAFLIRQEPHDSSPNTIAFFPYNPTAEPRVQFTYVPDTWFLLTCTYDTAVGAKIYENTTLKDSETDTGNLGTGNGISIGSIGIGGTILKDGGVIELAHMFYGSEVATANWISNFNNGLLNTDSTDTDGVKEIFYKPLIGNFDYFNNATAGFAVT